MRIKRLVIVIGIIVLLIFGLLAYVGLSLRVLPSGPRAPPIAPNASLSSFLLSKSVLSYDSNNYLVPFVELGYSSSNVSEVYANASLFTAPPPQNVYILNVSGSCYSCGQAQQATSLIAQDLASYGSVSPQNISIISMQGVYRIRNGSVLIIPSGAIPLAMLSPAQNSTEQLISYLLDRGTDIVYVGRNFSNATSGQVLVPVPQSSVPHFLMWTEVKNSTPVGSGFYFDRPLFYLTNGTRYGPLSYVHYSNGSVLVFPNYLSSWSNSSAAAQDIAKAVAQLFWVQEYASGSASLPAKNFSASSGAFGLPLTGLSKTYTYQQLVNAPEGYGRAVVYNSANYSLSQGSRYSYVYYRSGFSTNGTVSMPTSIVPTVQVPVAISIFTHSSLPVNIAPHITVYNMNLTQVTTAPLASFNASGNFSFIKPLALSIPPGEYILQVQGFYNRPYASALFNVTPVVIAQQVANYSVGKFAFLVTSGGVPLSGVDYQINVDGQYPQSGTLQNGVLTYALPSGVPSPSGSSISFNIYMLSGNFTYVGSNQPFAIKVNSQYIELFIVIIVAIVLITAIRAPNRDEFYIDIPIAREESKVPIKIKANELVSVFDKLNMHNQWRFMPLSVDEVGHAISSNIRYGNMQISLTHSNVEMMLDQLVSAGQLVGADGLYAPKAWMQASGHDIEYLATFKKLRVYMLSHAYQYTDIDTSERADIVASIHSSRAYIVIYSRTSKFQRVPVADGIKTYIAFLNEEKMDEFNKYIHSSTSADSDQLRLYISSGGVALLDADNPDDVLT